MSALDTVISFDPSPTSSNRLFHDCKRFLQTSQLMLPTIPEVSFKIRRVINDEKSSSSKIARVVQVDPSITARLIKIANSPLYRGRKHIESCPEALTRLGLKAAQNIITAFSMKSIFNARSPFINHEMIELWKHSSYVGAISAVIASRVPGFDPDRAMLAGLIHDIGAVPILIHADRHLDLISRPEDLAETIQLLSGDAGVHIIRHWNFPADFEQVVMNSENWYRNENGPADYADIVMIAQLHSLIGTVGIKAIPTICSLPAYQKMAESLQANDSVSVLDKAKNEIEYIWSMLA
ncbi:MAG: HDOD domain-containing protein [Gammaproteobacteria bacterium]